MGSHRSAPSSFLRRRRIGCDAIRPENTSELLTVFATVILDQHRFFTVVLGKFSESSRIVLGQRGQSLAMLTSTVTTELVMLERRVFSAAVWLGRHISSGRPLRGRNQSALDPAAWTALLRPDYAGRSPQ